MKNLRGLAAVWVLGGILILSFLVATGCGQAATHDVMLEYQEEIYTDVTQAVEDHLRAHVAHIEAEILARLDELDAKVAQWNADVESFDDGLGEWNADLNLWADDFESRYHGLIRSYSEAYVHELLGPNTP